MMPAEEIIKCYNEAKDKAKQIEIDDRNKKLEELGNFINGKR